jgi:WD40 repeat protein
LTLQGHDDAPSAIAFAPTGATLAAHDWYGGLIIWDAGTGKTLHKINTRTREVSALVYSPDGTRLYLGGMNDESKETVIQVWDVATGKQVSVIAKPHAPHRQYGPRVSSLAISPDGKWLASSGGDFQIRIWDLETTKERSAIAVSAISVKGLAFLKNGKHLTGSWNPSGLGGGSIIWDVASGKELYAFGGEYLTYWLAVSPNERLIAVGGMAEVIKVYDAALGE